MWFIKVKCRCVFDARALSAKEAGRMDLNYGLLVMHRERRIAIADSLINT